ncbi:hypothetical protein HanRHA438_Chr04g0183001 [Helianthus annuus]|nr:hypothetical protein HanRHA438_Chr04g0183001 [Helianthus annuus]
MDILQIPSLISNTTMVKKMSWMIFMATLWLLWKTRNDILFDDKSSSGNGILEDNKYVFMVETYGEDGFITLLE